MKLFSLSLMILAAAFSLSYLFKPAHQPQKDQTATVTFREDTAHQKIDVEINGKLFTSYRWPDNVCKPVLYPVLTSGGSEITRGFPIDPKTGERESGFGTIVR